MFRPRCQYLHVSSTSAYPLNTRYPFHPLLLVSAKGHAVCTLGFMFGLPTVRINTSTTVNVLA